MGLRILLAGAALALHAPPVGGPGIEARMAAFAQLMPKGAAVETLAEGFQWAEGPAWIADGTYLLLSDVPRNRIYRWRAGDKGAAIFLEPSGGAATAGFREPGSNGLKPGGRGLLLVADQGNRAIALLDLATKRKRVLAGRYEGRRFNSPNDLAVGADGAVWFTDPPYGLEGLDASPLKEQPVNGVYRLAPDGSVSRVESGLSFPNGIAFSPDGGTLYVSNSDPKRAVILAWTVGPEGTLSRRRTFADLTALAAAGLPGLPDGMCVDARGSLWATGPGGVHVFDPAGRELGRVSTGAAVSNCAFGGPDGRTLFMTSTHALAAVRTNVRGAVLRAPKLARLSR
jgi:gluconolactonase